jgi:N6-L-threonylcarbamoyladenine synthase
MARNHYDMEVIGNTIDDAAGEAFDKCGKVMGFPYPAGPLIDKLAMDGKSDAFRFSKPVVRGLNFSFSGLKTNFLYFIQGRVKEDPGFIKNNKADLCASLQHTIVAILVSKLVKAAEKSKVTEIGIAGGVSANSGLRKALISEASKKGWNLFIPPMSYTTDNAAMIGIAGYYKYLKGDFTGQDVTPLARFEI